MRPASATSLQTRAAEIAAHLGLWLLARALPHLPPTHRSWIGRKFVQRRFEPSARHLAGLFSEATLWWKNREYEWELNGEAELLRRLAAFDPRVVLDVGANVGGWTQAALAALPSAGIHAFEIDPATAEALRRNLADPRVVVNAFGLSDRAGEAEIFLDAAADTTRTSLTPLALDHPPAEAPRAFVRVGTGDDYAERHGLARIDLLKLDVEGAEMQVLEGFRRCFARRIVTAVQFEYGAVNLRTRRFLEDFHRVFAEHGFVLGKLYPEGVAFKAYEPEDEDFIGPNYVAVRQDRSDIVEALRCAPLRPL